MQTFLAFIFVFTILVLVHELGHFLAAKLMGVGVKEFAFGFPPRLYSKKVGSTNYILNLLPIGGYVQLIGEHGEDAKLKDSLVNKKPWQKAVIFGSGVAMNFLLAWFVLTIFYMVGGKAIISGMEKYPGIENTQRAQVATILKDSAAQKAGIQEGDIVTSVNGINVANSEEVIISVMDSGQKLKLGLEHEGQKIEKEVEVTGKQGDSARLGIGLETVGKIRAPFYLAPYIAVKETSRLTVMTVKEFGKFLSLALRTGEISDSVGGPVAIVKVTGVAASMGFAPLMQLLIMLSVSLGVVNILPFPALDGGHILFLGIEKVLGRELPTKFKEAVNKAGFALLLLLIVWITFKDLGRFGIFK